VISTVCRKPIAVLAAHAVRSPSPVVDHEGLSDNELMARFASGEEASLAELVRRYQRPLVAYLARIVNDAERARDLAQETFIRIARHAGSYRTSARFATWLFHIGRNVARDELRARRRRVSVAGDDEAADIEGAVGAGFYGRLEMREAILRALEELSPRDRALVLLRDMEGLSYEEVAEQVGLPLGTVKSGLSRARRRFRESFLSVAA
jgi:RNA polymerase sigma-70 factor (ECF subfamily)